MPRAGHQPGPTASPPRLGAPKIAACWVTAEPRQAEGASATGTPALPWDAVRTHWLCEFGMGVLQVSFPPQDSACTVAAHAQPVAEEPEIPQGQNTWHSRFKQSYLRLLCNREKKQHCF